MPVGVPLLLRFPTRPLLLGGEDSASRPLRLRALFANAVAEEIPHNYVPLYIFLIFSHTKFGSPVPPFFLPTGDRERFFTRSPEKGSRFLRASRRPPPIAQLFLTSRLRNFYAEYFLPSNAPKSAGSGTQSGFLYFFLVSQPLLIASI